MKKYLAAPAYTVEKIQEILTYLPATGQFQWKVDRGSTKANSSAGTWHRKTKYIALNRIQYKAADIANYMLTGLWQEMKHKDGDTKNNRWDNLEPVEIYNDRESLVKHYLYCSKTDDGWQIASDLPKQFLDVLKAKLDGF